jgi:hypothetical protein
MEEDLINMGVNNKYDLKYRKKEKKRSILVRMEEFYYASFSKSIYSFKRNRWMSYFLLVFYLF